MSIQVPEYKISSDQLLQLATPLGQHDQKPSTPIADFVPVSDSKTLSGKRFLRITASGTSAPLVDLFEPFEKRGEVENELYEKNKVDSYIPGWFGKGMKK